MQTMNRELKRFLRNHLYRHYRVHRMTSKARSIIRALFDSFLDDPLLLPPEAQRKATELEAETGISGRARAVADYIAGMTDRYAIQEYERIFTPAKLT